MVRRGCSCRAGFGSLGRILRFCGLGLSKNREQWFSLGLGSEGSRVRRLGLPKKGDLSTVDLAFPCRSGPQVRSQAAFECKLQPGPVRIRALALVDRRTHRACSKLRTGPASSWSQPRFSSPVGPIEPKDEPISAKHRGFITPADVNHGREMIEN